MPAVPSPEAAFRHSVTSVSIDDAGPSGAKAIRAAPAVTTNAAYDGTTVGRQRGAGG